jgi:hypothetical protein
MKLYSVCEAPFDGISKRSVRLAISELRTASDRYARENDLERANRIDVVARALEETLEDSSIEWLDV